LARDAWMFIIPLALLAALCLIAARLWGPGWLVPAAVLAVLALYVAYFFRDPARSAPPDPSLVVSPADGRVIRVVQVDDPYVGKSAWQVDIFLNIFNVHIQRNPFCRPAKVAALRYNPGRFLNAANPKASLDNEQNWISLESQGAKAQVRQIAGLIARRIACWVKPGQALAPGGKLGLIRFGSQVDLILPAGTRIMAVPGQKVRGGETQIAQLAAPKRPAKAAASKPKPASRRKA